MLHPDVAYNRKMGLHEMNSKMVVVVFGNVRATAFLCEQGKSRSTLLLSETAQERDTRL